MRRRDGGQATVELALVLPFVIVLALVVVQVVVVANGSVLAVHSAREGARVAALGRDDAAVLAAAAAGGGFAPGSVRVTVVRSPETVRVTVVVRQPTSVPIVGRLVGDVEHTQTLTMWREDTG